MEQFKSVRHVRIFLGDNEWSSTGVMERVATNFINDNPGETPLVVTVHEHGGWALGYAMIEGELKVISSANDQAQYADKVSKFKKAIYHAKWEDFPEIRRNNNRTEFSVLGVGDTFDQDGHIWTKQEGRFATLGDKREEFGDCVSVLPVKLLAPLGWAHV